MNYPFGSAINDHIKELESNLEMIRSFAHRFPDAQPTSCSCLLPAIIFPSSATGWCRDNLGREGWVVRGGSAYKEVSGISVELLIEAKTPQPFTL